jgi:hypothetical protein
MTELTGDNAPANLTEKSMTLSLTDKPRLDLLVGVFDSERQAEQLVERLIEDEFPADRISVLHKGGGMGDDMLGISFDTTGERVRTWTGQGALWGGLLGLLAGASGLFVLPGLGALLAAGPIVELIGGAVAGSLLGSGAMAGAAALSGLATALHHIGLPEDRLRELHQWIEEGKIVVILHLDPGGDLEQYLTQMKWAGADPVIELPVRI